MRILAQCPQCHTQFDVSGRAPGASVRCHCGATIQTPEPRAQDAAVVRCPNCGGARAGDGPNCAFCGTLFSLADKGWGSMCPGCFCRLPIDARFCVECGLQINPEKLEAVGADLACPHCTTPLHWRKLQKIEVCECGGCGGLWLSANTFEILCKDEELMAAEVDGLEQLHGAARAELPGDEPVHYVHCPVCKDVMNRTNFAKISGIIIDLCRDCGVWLDNQELNRILQFVHAGGMEKSREYVAQNRSLEGAPAAGGWTEAAALGAMLSMPVEGVRLGPTGNSLPPLLRLVARIARALIE